jgi:hypothetical protein
MYIITRCLVCKSDEVSFEPTYLSRFVLSRIEHRLRNIDLPVSSIKCNHCGFFSSNLRFEPHEQDQLYKDYRGYEYNKLRIQIEGDFYRRLVGNFTSPESIKIRMQGINQIIDRSINVANIKNVLDFGGGSGHFIPDKFKFAGKYVYDISGVNLCPGIKRYDSGRQTDWDYIQCCHVLEHVSDPISFLKDMLKLANIQTLIYIEVPNCDGPAPGGVWHEHINSFFEHSLEFLMNRVDLKVIDKQTLNGCIGLLVKKAQE